MNNILTYEDPVMADVGLNCFNAEFGKGDKIWRIARSSLQSA